MGDWSLQYYSRLFLFVPLGLYGEASFILIGILG